MNIKLVVTTITLCVISAISAADQSVGRSRSATYPPVVSEDRPTTPVTPPPTPLVRQGAIAGGVAIRDVFASENTN